MKALACALVVAAFLVSGIAQAQTLTVDWTWKLSHKCSTISPALKANGIPEGTKSLSVEMVDLDYTAFDHGGGIVSHDGKGSATIPEGALKNYRGPCPPNFFSFGHDYKFTVKAMSGDNNSLATGSMTKTFSVKSVSE
jgi:phosphatidylethanolamine-binding protein (PEBP) family uncharacterized protein